MSTKLATILADFTTNLATALAVGGTSVSLQSATDDDSVALPAGTYFFTLDGQNAGKEHIVCTLSGTSLTNIKSVSRQGVETTGVVRPHRIGATVSLTDFAHILFINRLVGGIDMFDSSAPLEYDATASITKPNQFATKAYIDGIAIAGAPNASTTLQGLVQLATQAQIDARTTTGSTGALLVATPDKTRSTLLSDYIADTGTANTYVIAPVPAITAYAAGQRFSFKATNANTGTSTVNASGLGAKTIKKVGGGSNLAANDILAGQIVDVEYDGTNMQMMSPVANIPATDSFGDGSDGNVTISTPTTLTRDMYYNNLTVNDVLTTGNYRIFVNGTLTGTGTIQSNGNNGTTATTSTGAAGGTVTAGYFSNTPGVAGGNGSINNGNAGANASASTSGLGSTGSSGGAGGSYSLASKTGGAGGTGAGVSVFIKVFVFKFISFFGFDINASNVFVKLVPQGQSAGGGGGGGNTSTAGGGGGGGGASGGFILIIARIWTGTFVIKALGGNGGGGVNSSFGGGGGGGGGNGGISAVIYAIKTWTGSYLFTAGTGGVAGTGFDSNAVAGTNGTNGTSYEILMDNLT